MEILRKLRWVLYPCVFALVFIFAGYCTFPESVLKEMAESSITNMAVGLGPKTHGLPEVGIKGISLWRLSGVKLDGLKITWPGKKTESPLLLEMESLKGRAGIFSLLSGGQSISALAKLYQGEIDLVLKMRKAGLDVLKVDGSKINLGKITFIESAWGAPLQGVLNLAIDIKSNSELSKDGSGTVKLNLDDMSYGPGSIRLPAGGFVSSLTVPKVNLGKLVVDISLEKGEFTSKTITLLGGDLEATLSLTAILGKSPANSRISGDGWFSVKREFVNSNETLKMLYDLIPELRAAQQADGKVGLTIRGSILRPDFRLERYSGAKHDKNVKKEAVAEK